MHAKVEEGVKDFLIHQPSLPAVKPCVTPEDSHTIQRHMEKNRSVLCLPRNLSEICIEVRSCFWMGKEITD